MDIDFFLLPSKIHSPILTHNAVFEKGFNSHLLAYLRACDHMAPADTRTPEPFLVKSLNRLIDFILDNAQCGNNKVFK